MKTVAFVYENGDWGTGFAAGWKKLAKEAGYKVVLDEPYPSTASDLTPVVLKIKRAKPDVLFLTSNASDAILLTNTIANMKVHVKAIIGSGGGHADPTFLKAVGDNAEGVFDIVEWETDLNKPGVTEANAKFNKLYGYNLTGEAVDAYASTYLIKEALEKAASTDPAKFVRLWPTTNCAAVLVRSSPTSVSNLTKTVRISRQHWLLYKSIKIMAQ